ncbi:MAG: hypothetical protein A2075_11645 [Geobacteraceae bacterium GWC2_58_44]|nr:MAG: hypothetical protein A2075_11645 [Geobacteraceae bacterium GWC2_58_44]HBG04796.1 hypothetical protein [Geobacter sp.]
MLKKKLAALIAAALMMMSASSAFAAFADLELIRIYYDRAGNEYATDLGLVSNFVAAGAVNSVEGTFGTLATGYSVYFALDRTAGMSDLWATGSSATPSVIVGGSNGLTGIKSGTTPMYTLYNTQGGTDYVGSAAASNSFRNKLSATQGTLASAINLTTRLNTEASLAGIIGQSSGSVEQVLYFWDNALTGVASEKIGTVAATIVTNFDGSSLITSATPAPAATTPIPPAFLLMGSGLLGLVGLRRKAKVA